LIAASPLVVVLVGWVLVAIGVALLWGAIAGSLKRRAPRESVDVPQGHRKLP
jgi:hypothetical protein